MSEASQRFTNQLVRPFATSPEVEVQVREMVGTALKDDAIDVQSWDDATEALRRSDRSWWARHWKTVLLVVMAVISVPSLITTVVTMGNVAKSIVGASSFMDGNVPSNSGVEALGLTEEKQWILYGDIRQPSQSLRYKNLWLRYPENPAYYADYSIRYATELGKLPPDFLETAEKIDPDNGWFPSFAAAVTAKDAVKSQPRSKREIDDRTPRQWEVLDPAQLEAAIVLFKEGSKMPRFDSYQAELAKKRLAILPPATGFLDQNRRFLFLSSFADSLQWQYLSSAISAEAGRLASAQKPQEFLELVESWEISSARMLKDSDGTISVLLAHASIQSPLRNFMEASSNLGLGQDSANFQKLDDDLYAYRGAMKSDEKLEESAFLKSHAGFFVSFGTTTNQAVSTPALDKINTAPSRLVEHAFADRITTAIFMIFLLLASFIVFVYRFSQTTASKLSGRLTHTLKGSDWIWLWGIGGLAPLVFYQVVVHFSLLGGRDWAFFFAKGVPHLIQLVGWLAAALIAPLVVARWRLRKRFIGLDLKLAGPRLGSIALLLAILSVPLSGAVYLTRLSAMNWLIPGTFSVVIAFIWLLVVGLRAIFGSRSGALGRHTMARVLLPVFLFSAFSSGLLLPIFENQERQWVSIDTLGNANPGGVGLTKYEHDVAMARKAEVTEIFTKWQKSR
jgi:hypothetical protein